jgi:hypothetical protein
MKRTFLFGFGLLLVGFGALSFLGAARSSNPYGELAYTTYVTDRGVHRCSEAAIRHNGVDVCGSLEYNYTPFLPSVPRINPAYKKVVARDQYKYRGSFYSLKPGYSPYELLSAKEQELYLKNQLSRYPLADSSRRNVAFNLFDTDASQRTNSFVPQYQQNPIVLPKHAVKRSDGVYFAFYQNPSAQKQRPTQRNYNFYTSN